MSAYSIQVNVYRGIREKENIYKKDLSIYKKIINSTELIPGDVIEIPENLFMPADIVLLNGTCIMNESMITGESIPVIKTGLPINNLTFNSEENIKESFLISGTKCIESRNPNKDKFPVLGMVYTSGFETVKGKLVRSILFTKNTSFDFLKDSLKFIVVLGLFLLGGLGYSIHSYKQFDGTEDEMSNKDLAFACLDMITIVVPPALPACMSIGIGFAISRLRNKQIYCIAPNKINVAGKIDVMCFDKTGTLTEEGLEMYGVLPSKLNNVYNNSEFQNVLQVEELLFDQLQTKNKNSVNLLEALVSCHNLTIINEKIVGDTLDVKMFEPTKWNIKETGIENQNYISIVSSQERQLAVLKKFQFSSKLQRMSVIVKNLNDGIFKAFFKGSPEKIREFCSKNSIPKDFHKILEQFTKKGLRVLACGYKFLEIQENQIEYIHREDIEKEINFLGFLIMENQIKDKTNTVIEDLHNAKIRTVMITGDNILTAISVAKQCYIVPENKKVYYGELMENKKNEKIIKWKDFDKFENKLDKNLIPKPGKEIFENNVLSVENRFNDLPDFPKLNSSAILVTKQKNEIITSSAKLTNNKPKILKKYNSLENVGSSIDLDSIFPIITVVDEDYEGWLPSEDYTNYTLALSGDIFSFLIEQFDNNKIDPLLFKRILDKCNVFARMKPKEKADLIKHLKGLEMNNLVGMCGDGANDCAALKAADVGISLSDAEASIAAPFTSKIQDISCVLSLFKEGRCALITSLQCFKYMALYSVIQFMTVCLLNGAISTLSQTQFLWVDLFTIFPAAILMGYTKPHERLSELRPVSRLISFPILASIIGQILIQTSIQVSVYILIINNFTICVDVEDSGENAFYCFENSALFLVTNFQYVAVVLAFSIGPPFRKPFYSNYLFAFMILILTTLNIYLLFDPSEYLQDVIPVIKF